MCSEVGRDYVGGSAENKRKTKGARCQPCPMTWGRFLSTQALSEIVLFRGKYQAQERHSNKQPVVDLLEIMCSGI